MKLAWGRKVVGMRVWLATTGLMLVERLLRQAWMREAPRRLVAATSAEHPGDRS